MLASFLERVSYCKELAELSHMKVEFGVVVPRLQPFDFVGVKGFLIFHRGQIPLARKRTVTAVTEHPFSS